MNKTTAFVADLIAIIVFAVLARMAHQSADMPFNFGGVLSTLWPFALGLVIGWLVTRGGRGVWIWLITVVVGLAIWGIRNAAIPHWSFILVATIMSALLMLGWRGIYALTQRKNTKANA
ncbi:DUF3054 domain-containing protein [Corynebacterium lubricantis]|uniref:DUF3054 domain-containing protein n=1 Tax=Corynebacterium lubricantis TaxID=541095 RepID=UPI00036A8C57|nr:DUF3054 domain-containing protein [Corynebacterium lubricantis]